MSKKKREAKQVERGKDRKRKNRWRNQKWGGKGVLHRWDGWMDRWVMGWTVENLSFVLPPPANDVAEEGSTCLLLAGTQVLGGQIESCPDLIPHEVRPVFTTLKKKRRGCIFSTCGMDIW